jgi:hypothetical protein
VMAGLGVWEQPTTSRIGARAQVQRANFQRNEILDTGFSPREKW